MFTNNLTTNKSVTRIKLISETRNSMKLFTLKEIFALISNEELFSELNEDTNYKISKEIHVDKNGEIKWQDDKLKIEIWKKLAKSFHL